MNTTPTWTTLTLDESLALRTAATRLAVDFDFDGIVGTETIERFLRFSFDLRRSRDGGEIPALDGRTVRPATTSGVHEDRRPA